MDVSFLLIEVFGMRIMGWIVLGGMVLGIIAAIRVRVADKRPKAKKQKDETPAPANWERIERLENRPLTQAEMDWQLRLEAQARARARRPRRR